MKTYQITYTTNREDRLTACLEGSSKTKVYLHFVLASPKHYIITDMKEKNENENQG